MVNPDGADTTKSAKVGDKKAKGRTAANSARKRSAFIRNLVHIFEPFPNSRLSSNNDYTTSCAGKERPGSAAGLAEAVELSSISRSTIYREMAEGRFPAARELAPLRVGWLENEIVARHGNRQRRITLAQKPAQAECKIAIAA